MGQAYGRLSRGKPKATSPSSDRLKIQVHGRHTIEQFSFELQKMLAQLDDLNAVGIEACTIYLKPLDQNGEHITLWNDKGAAIAELNVPPQPLSQPYRRD